MVRNFALLLCFVFSLTSAFAQSDQDNGSTTFRFLNSNYHGEQFSHEKIIQGIRENFNLSDYRQVVIAVANDPGGTPYLLLQLLSRKYHRVDTARVDLNSSFDFRGIQKEYKMTPEDFKNQFKVDELEPRVNEAEPRFRVSEAERLAQFELRLSNLQCPDQDVQFVTFAWDENEPTEQSAARDVADEATNQGFKGVLLLGNDATHDKLISYLKCPNLKGVFYDGDANAHEIITHDGALEASEIARNFKFGRRVTHIWLACQAFNNPMLSTMIATVGAQKYAAGINDLEIGPSDRAGACAMKAAIDGQQMTAAFWNCYKAEDKPTDQWGFDGPGSDLFGH